MSDIMCENCGSKHFEEVNGIVTCVSCGTKYPNIKLSTIGIDEELKEKEIRRLAEVNSKKFALVWEREPKFGLFTDEEILKYAPDSEATRKIRYKNSKTFREKINNNPTYKAILILVAIWGFIGIILLIALLT